MLKFKDIKIGQTIQDSEGNLGTIIKIEDIHNVIINYYYGLKDTNCERYGILCLDPDCDRYEINAELIY